MIWLGRAPHREQPLRRRWKGSSSGSSWTVPLALRIWPTVVAPICLFGILRKRLASFVIARRGELGYRDRRAFSKAVGISDRAIGKVELRQSGSMSTLGVVENGLGWEPGSAQRVLEGGDPAIKGQQAPA